LKAAGAVERLDPSSRRGQGVVDANKGGQRRPPYAREVAILVVGGFYDVAYEMCDFIHRLLTMR
jgi:hypothetical protein